MTAGAKAIFCDASYLALPLLTSLAAAIGNTRRLQLKRGWAVPPILWGAVVGESGSAKTPAFMLAMRPVQERERKAMARNAKAATRHAADLALWDKELTQWKRDKSATCDAPARPADPAAARYMVSDTTVEALAPMLSENPRPKGL